MFWILGVDIAMIALAEMLRGKSPYLDAAAGILETQFRHAPWEGLTFYDFILPLFIFITGVSIVPSLTKLVERKGIAMAHLRVLRRAALLYVLGVIYYGGVGEHWNDIRLLGVLQRIAICYLFASLLFLHFGIHGLIAATVIVLGGYWAVMSFVPVPGMETVSFEPDENLANWIDAYYLPGRLWDVTRDPEGLLSTVPAIGTCLMGVLAGRLLMDARLTAAQKSIGLIGAGILLVAAGHLWSVQFPLIKSIWTSSYALVAGGYAAILLGVFHQIADGWKCVRWATLFIWIGANAIALYLLANVTNFERLAVRIVGGDVGRLLDAAVTPGTGRFVAHVLGMAFAVALAAFLYRRKILLRV